MTDRARVPFAVVAVLLLVGTMAVSMTTGLRTPPAAEPPTERALERATAAASTALRGGVREAARQAARQPVLGPANTTAGRTIDADTAFTDALRLRIYVAVRGRLEAIDQRAGDVHASASLPPVDATERSIRDAIDAVHVAALEDDRAIRVRVTNVTLVADRDGREVERIERTWSFVVRTPVMALHRQVTRFERRLNNPPRRPGLGRRLTAQLYPIAWTRGYAQYGGAPIANVVANRHVGLATNRGLLGEQRSAFGGSDPAGRRAVVAAGRRAAVQDLLAGTTDGDPEKWAARLLATARDRGALPGPITAARANPGPDASIEIGVNHTADRVFVDMVAGGDIATPRASSRETGTPGPGGHSTNASRWRASVVRDLATLRDRVRNLSVTVERGALGSYDVNPPAALARLVAERRERLVDAPETPQGPTESARVAARAEYVDRVEAALDRRAARRRARRGRLAALFSETGAGSLDGLPTIVGHGAEPDAAGRTPGGPTVSGSPPYLTLTAVDGAGVEGEPSLAARNHNLFASPHGTAIDTVLGLLGDRGTDLGTAARTLRVATTGPAEVSPDPRLSGSVERSVRRLRGRVRAVLADEGIGTTPADRQAIVSSALSRWPSPAGRALALTNGSAVPAIVRAATNRTSRDIPTSRATLGARLRTALAAERRTEDTRPPAAPVDRTAAAVERTTMDRLRRTAPEAQNGTVEGPSRAALARRLAALPAGLPVAPVPGHWYATVNVWDVTVRGTYGRFTVRTARGPPGRSLTYVRDASPVALDVDDDGRPERLGRSTRVSFETGTTVVVVVPPGPSGVGDTDGTADERSPGWPGPGYRGN